MRKPCGYYTGFDGFLHAIEEAHGFYNENGRIPKSNEMNSIEQVILRGAYDDFMINRGWVNFVKIAFPSDAANMHLNPSQTGYIKNRIDDRRLRTKTKKKRGALFQVLEYIRSRPGCKPKDIQRELKYKNCTAIYGYLVKLSLRGLVEKRYNQLNKYYYTLYPIEKKN